MKKIVALCALGLLPLSATPLLASGGPNKVAGFELDGNLNLVSDYVLRGITQSDFAPALQGTVNASHDSGVYLGFFASSIDFNDGDSSSLELDVLGGYTREWPNGLSMDLGAVAYIYPKAPLGGEYDYREYYLGGGYALNNASLSAKYFYSDNYFGPGDESNSYLDTQLAYELPYKITLKGHYGHAFGSAIKSWGMGISNFSDYSVGIATELAGFGMEVNYIGMDNDGRRANRAINSDGRGVLSVSRSF